MIRLTSFLIVEPVDGRLVFTHHAELRFVLAHDVLVLARAVLLLQQMFYKKHTGNKETKTEV